MQNISLLRALEGELARTISTLGPVRAARVHIVMPKRELFSRNQQEPTASVILTLGGPSQLTVEQIAAIQHLTATAVPGLQPNRISIVDDKGKLLARGFEGDDAAGLMAAKSEERRRAFESRLAQAIEHLLEKSIGYGKVHAEVTADMDFDRINTNEEIFNPEGQVVRSTQTVESSTNTREADAQAVSVATNLPDAAAGGDNATSSSTEKRNEETVNFEISKRVVNHIRESGVVKRLSVAVLIDGTYAKNPDTGQTIYTERDQKVMDQLATLVRSAVGYNADRGDTIEVVNMRFAGADAVPEEPLEINFFGLDKADLIALARWLVLGIVAILILLLVVRPLLSRVLEMVPRIGAAAAAESQMLAEQAATPALAGPAGTPGEPGFEELIDIDRVEGRVRASSVKKVGEIVEKHPEQAIAIVRAWMYQES